MGRGHEPDVRKKHLGDGIHPFGELGWIERSTDASAEVATALERGGETVGRSSLEEQTSRRTVGDCR